MLYPTWVCGSITYPHPAASSFAERLKTLLPVHACSADLQQLLGDFEQDLEAVVPSQWKHMIGSAHEQQGVDGSSYTTEAALAARGKLRSTLANLTSSSRAASFAAGGGAVSAGASAALPVVWAHKLDAVLAVLRLAVEEWGRATDGMHNTGTRAELLESNVEEVR